MDKKITRNTKFLQNKMKKCEVKNVRQTGNILEIQVLSTSSETYTVKVYNEQYECNCKWSKFNPTRVCTHRLAAKAHVTKEQTKYRVQNVVSDVYDGRQHRKQEIFQDVTLLTRLQPQYA